MRARVRSGVRDASLGSNEVFVSHPPPVSVPASDIEPSAPHDAWNGDSHGNHC